MTFENRLEDNPSSANYFAGPALTKRGLTNRYVTYQEGVFVGYRGFEKNVVKPSYPFGYGLTYSTFDYSDLSVVPAGDGFDVSFTITNTGKREAAEVAQVYVGYKDTTIPHPVKELKGYDKVTIKRGATHHFVVSIPYSNLECYDIATRRMVRAAQGIEDLRIYVGASSADIRLTRE